MRIYFLTVIFVLVLPFVIIFSSSVLYAKVQMESVNITAMTFNVQMTSAYTALNKKQMVADIIHANKVDIIGFQEYHWAQLNELAKLLPKYSWLGVGRDDGKTRGEMGPIFYSTEKFELVQQKTFWLSETPEVPGSMSWGTANTRIATWGEFRDKRNNRIFFVFNTHLDHVSSEARTKGSELLLNRITELTNSYPVFVTGDFNYSERSQGYKVLTEGKPGSVQLFDSKYASETESFGPSGTYNGYNNPNPKNKIDFIFGNPFIKFIRHGVIDDRPNGIYISDHYPVIVELDFQFPESPLLPSLSASSDDAKIILSWDDVSEIETREPFAGDVNDFEGYKLYRSTDRGMSDAVLVSGGWNVPLYRKPIFQCDLVDDKKGYTDYGIENGAGYYLGNDSGIQHFYQDTTVQNGITYYYVLTAYDFGIPQAGKGYPPRENGFFIESDERGNIKDFSKNVAIATSHQSAAGYIQPSINIDKKSELIGTGALGTEIVDLNAVKANHTYKIKFHVDTLSYSKKSPQFRHPFDLLYVNDGFNVYDITENNALVYKETKEHYTRRNLIYDNLNDYWHFNSEETVVSDVFDGVKLWVSNPLITAEMFPDNSGWVTGKSPIQVTISPEGTIYFPWQYEIVFTGESSAYQSRNSYPITINNQNGENLSPQYLLLGQTFNFYVINKSFPDSNGQYEQLDLVVYDVNANKEFDLDVDYVLAGHVVKTGNAFRWAGTVFSIDFHQVKDISEMPKPNDVYRVDFKRPFFETDSVLFTVNPEVVVDKVKLKRELDRVKVVPNPYIVTNSLESEYGLPERKIMFTHLPALCTIKIFTVSGVLVDEIQVDHSVANNNQNSASNGTTYWDLKSKEGNDIATGYYIYHIKSIATGDEKMGKLSIIK